MEKVAHDNRAAFYLKKYKIQMFAVGIGNCVSVSQLKDIASKPSNVILMKHYFYT